MRQRFQVFTFRDPGGNEVFKLMEVGELERRLSGGAIVENGVKLRLDSKHTRSSAGIAQWPMTSLAAGCHPSQVRKFEQDSVDKGVPTRFNARGDAIFESRSHRRNYLRAYGMHDKDACYGD